MRETSEDIRRIKVKKNGRKVGNAKVYRKNMKKVILIGTTCLLFSTGFAAGRISKDTIQRNITFDVDYGMDFEARYDGIPYVVRGGDTLLGIVYSYESDRNRVYQYKSDIEYVNKLYNQTLVPGDVIYLCGVPSSKLDLFGFTDNYNFFEPTYEVEDRLAFLRKVLEHENFDSELDAKIDQLESQYKDYQYSYVPGDEDRLDMLLEDLRDLCEDVEHQYGYSFYNNREARPLDSATRNLDRISMGL